MGVSVSSGAGSTAGGGLSPAERAVAGAVDRDELLAILGTLVATPSCDGRESAAQRAIAALMREVGLEVDLWEIDLGELARHPACSWEIERGEALGVVGRLGGGRGGRDLILNGHIDVVGAGDRSRWRHDPWRLTVEDGRAYGRGTVDMKGGLACALAAAGALQRSGVRLRGRLLLESVAGEEDGGLGTLAAILRGYRADGAVVVEPTRLAVVPVQAGALTFRLRVAGLAAHAAMRWEGVSAVDRFLALQSALRTLEAARTAEVRSGRFGPLFARYPVPCPVSVGRLQAGEWPSTVPEEAVAEGRFGVLPGEDVATAKERFERAVAAAAAVDPWLRDHPPVVEWWGGAFAAAVTDPEAEVVTTLAGVHADLNGAAPVVEGVTYGADMRLLVHEGHVPTVLYGPGDVACAHQPDEHVPVDELVRAAQALAVLAMRFCGHDAADTVAAQA